MSKFQVGEIAEYIGSHKKWRGLDVEILLVGPIPALTSCRDPSGNLWRCTEISDYFIRRGDRIMFVDERELRKRRPPGADIVREFMYELPREVTA